MSRIPPGPPMPPGVVSQPPPPMPPGVGMTPSQVPGNVGRPHRGGMILVFGILGLCVCMIFGIVAWVMGSGDMQAMEFGEMDASGYALTKAGKICGQISVILTIAMFGLWLLFFFLAVGAGMAGGV